MIDYSDQEGIKSQSKDNITLSEEYRTSRELYGEAKKKLFLELAKAYRNGEADRKVSFDKAIILLASRNPELEPVLGDYAEQPEVYKGIEKVIDARQSDLSVNQSLMKNERIMGGFNG